MGFARTPLSWTTALGTRFDSIKQTLAHGGFGIVARFIDAGLGLFLFGGHYFLFFLRLFKATKSAFVILLRGFAAPAIFFCLPVNFLTISYNSSILRLV